MYITQKGQVTIPMPIREKYRFLPDTEIVFKEDNGRVYIEKAQPDLVKEGPFDYVRGRADSTLSTAEIMKLTRDIEA